MGSVIRSDQKSESGCWWPTGSLGVQTNVRIAESSGMNQSRARAIPDGGRSKIRGHERHSGMSASIKGRRNRNMKTCKFVLGALLLSGVAASAQEAAASKFEVGLTYSWLHVKSANCDFQRTGNGGSGYFEYNVSP